MVAYLPLGITCGSSYANLNRMEALYRTMTSLCARREYCCADIAEKLRKKGASSEDAEVLIDRLIEEGYIDEGRYARAFVHDKTLYNGWGRVKVAQQLRAKGICNAYINEAIERGQSIEESGKMSDREDTVRLMTVHQSKGLEYPVVFFADTAHEYFLKDTEGSPLYTHAAGFGKRILHAFL